MTEARIIPLREPPAARGLGDREDDELMLLVRAGESAAMTALVSRYHARVISFCIKHTGDVAAAEELAQEVFVRLWRTRGGYRAEGKLAVLLYTTARNLCRNHSRWWRRRSRWLAPSREHADESVPCSGDQLDELIERERRREVERAIAELPSKLREAIVLRFEHALAYDQIAEIVSANESTVRSRVHLGIARVRELLARGQRP
jgi:RNA polymerase sigma-70 factor (ECF subfamily)